MMLHHLIMIATAAMLTFIEFRTAVRRPAYYGDSEVIVFIKHPSKTLTADLITAMFGSLILQTAIPIEVTGWRVWVIPVVFLAALLNSLLMHSASLSIDKSSVSLRWGLLPKTRVRFSEGCIVTSSETEEGEDDVWICDLSMKKKIEIGSFVCVRDIIDKLRSHGAIIKNLDPKTLPPPSSALWQVVKAVLCSALIWVPVFYGPYSLHL